MAWNEKVNFLSAESLLTVLYAYVLQLLLLANYCPEITPNYYIIIQWATFGYYMPYSVTVIL